MKSSFLKKVIIAVLTVTMLAGTLLGSAGCDKKPEGSVNEFSFWMAVSESSEHYLTYQDNPVLKYILQNKTFKDQDGNDAKVSLAIQHPPVGKEVDNLNTLISTGSYSDVMDLTYGGSLEEWYRDGLILDLTDYVENSMPNFKKFVDEHPELYNYLTVNIDGERKFLSITGFKDILDADSLFAGFCYRRDWIVKYGEQPETLFDPMSGESSKANPKAGQKFSGYYSLDKNGNDVRHETIQDDSNGESWVDDVVFPSGNSHPIYISDWEWMFEIFARAIEAQNITDGYVLSLYYPGYISNGDIATGFGGGCPIWYYDKNAGEFKFGAVSDNFKTYLMAMNNWWNKGWIDRQFAERSNDVFYRIDETSFRSGKVGLWVGAAGNLDNKLYNASQPLTEGIVVFGAPQPINDIYGSDEQKLKIPDTMYQPNLTGGGIAITDKAEGKDITLLLNFIDYLFSDEGSLIRTMGLSAEQATAAKDPFYEKIGLANGAYRVENRDGQDYYLYDPIIQANSDLRTAATGAKLVGRTANRYLDLQFGPAHLASRENWLKYEATGFKYYEANSLLPMEDQQTGARIQARIEAEYMRIVAPQFIKGEKNFEADWETFISDLQKRNYQTVTDLLNKTLEG